jgi:hypothetical protein
MLRRLLITSCAALWLMTGAGAALAQPIDTKVYQPSDANFANPERGFFVQRTPLWRNGERIPLEPDELAQARAEGISLVRTYYVLDRYRDRPLDDFVLEALVSDMNTVRDSGFKVILRFSYNFPVDNDRDPNFDAPLRIVLQHIAQLKPILRANADVIAHMEAGFIGYWGEWHSSSNRLIDHPERGINAPARAILSALLDVLPKTRMIALRYPLLKQQLFGSEPLNAIQAFSGSPQARLAAHDDCFLGSETNWGTYLDAQDEPRAAYFKAYLNADNRYVVQSGESCTSDGEARKLIVCENALAELAYLRWSSLNRDYHPEVISAWQREGCFEQIAQRLGYRLRLLEGSILQQGRTAEIKLTLQNDGFASPYNPRGFVLALRSADGALQPLLLDATPDPRLWLPDDLITLSVRAKLPDNLSDGRYELMLSLPDPEPSLSADPRYAIRLANQGLWNARTGYHALDLWVQVGK